ncbi:MAG: Clp protease N-terminal domain-containing protein, partial [Clostridiales bacterium]
MINKMTERAQRVLKIAEMVAVQYGGGVIGTEYILWAILNDQTGIACQILNQIGINKELLEANLDLSPQNAHSFRGYSPRAKMVIQKAMEEATLRGDNYVGTEHLLLGLMAEGEGFGSVFIRQISGADLSTMRQYVANILDQGGDIAYNANNSNQPLGDKSCQGGKGGATPTLDEFARDLTLMAKEDKLDPVIGRNKEIERVIQILSRR